MESLFTNTLAFEFPKDPKIFYFSKKDREAVSLTKLSHQLFPCNIKEIFPDISNADTIYTSFDRKLEGFKPLTIDFSKENFSFIKRYYNREIKHYFTIENILVEPTFIKDNQIWLRSTDATSKRIKDCVVYDRFTIKVNYNHFFNTPELVLSYDRQAKVYRKAVFVIPPLCSQKHSPKGKTSSLKKISTPSGSIFSAALVATASTLIPALR